MNSKNYSNHLTYPSNLHMEIKTRIAALRLDASANQSSRSLHQCLSRLIKYVVKKFYYRNVGIKCIFWQNMDASFTSSAQQHRRSKQSPQIKD